MCGGRRREGGDHHEPRLSSRRGGVARHFGERRATCFPSLSRSPVVSCSVWSWCPPARLCSPSPASATLLISNAGRLIRRDPR